MSRDPERFLVKYELDFFLGSPGIWKLAGALVALRSGNPGVRRTLGSDWYCEISNLFRIDCGKVGKRKGKIPNSPFCFKLFFDFYPSETEKIARNRSVSKISEGPKMFFQVPNQAKPLGLGYLIKNS
jgi:hypothetical protein